MRTFKRGLETIIMYSYLNSELTAKWKTWAEEPSNKEKTKDISVDDFKRPSIFQIIQEKTYQPLKVP